MDDSMYIQLAFYVNESKVKKKQVIRKDGMIYVSDKHSSYF